MNTQSIVKVLPSALQALAVKLLYRKHGHRCMSVKKMYGGKFWIYEVNGHFIPSDSLGWFVTPNYYMGWVYKLSARAYQPQPGDIVLDIGAGIGEEAFIFSDIVHGHGKVFSIEANYQAFEVLQKVVQLNKLQNVNTYNIAIDEQDGTASINIPAGSYVSGSIGSNAAQDRLHQVPAKRMDTFIRENNIDRIDLLKCNIEGAERFVIASLGEAIKKVRHVAIACHDFRYLNEGNEFFRTRGLVEKYLQDNNFTLLCREDAQINGIAFTDWVYGVNNRLD